MVANCACGRMEKQAADCGTGRAGRADSAQAVHWVDLVWGLVPRFAMLCRSAPSDTLAPESRLRGTDGIRRAPE